MIYEIQNLSVCAKGESEKPLVQDVSFSIFPGEIVALVGASGSGKTTTALAGLGLLADGLIVASGRVLFEGDDLLKIPPVQLRRFRGRRIAVVFQEPLYAFDPLFTIGAQIDEVLEVHFGAHAAERKDKALALLKRCGIEEAERVYRSYPHQLSGGLRQRAMIAQALAGGPKLIIADEPTSSIDVTLQAKVLELFQQLRKELNLSILLITHDLGLVRHLADRVVVLRQGEIVEQGRVENVLTDPQHPYTQQLMAAGG